MQKVILVGNLAKDLEVRDTSTGKKVASFSMAVNQKKDEAPTWWDVAIFENKFQSFEKIFSYLKKGSKVHLIGEMDKPTMYKDKNGIDHISLKVYPSSIDFLPSSKPTEDKEAAPF